MEELNKKMMQKEKASIEREAKELINIIRGFDGKRTELAFAALTGMKIAIEVEGKTKNENVG
jgi:hypothetical protein